MLEGVAVDLRRGPWRMPTCRFGEHINDQRMPCSTCEGPSCEHVSWRSCMFSVLWMVCLCVYIQYSVALQTMMQYDALL